MRVTAVTCLLVTLLWAEPPRATARVAVHGGIADKMHTLALNADGEAAAEVDIELVLDPGRNEARAYFTHVALVETDDGTRQFARNLAVFTLLVGLVVGGLGSYFSVRRYLSV